MPRRRPPKSVWDDEKTMYDIRPEISEEIMDIIKDSERKPRGMANTNYIRQSYPQKLRKHKPNYYKKYRNDHLQKHFPMLRKHYRDMPPPEIHQSHKSNMRIKRGNPETIMTFTI